VRHEEVGGGGQRGDHHAREAHLQPHTRGRGEGKLTNVTADDTREWDETIVP
jgi:hypothetical protein